MALEKPARRRVLKRMGAGSAMVGMAVGMPSGWEKPLVDTVILPAHAACSVSCDVSLSLVDAMVPEACSGSVFPPVTLLIEVSGGCGDIELTSVSAELPAQASMVSEQEAGDVVSAGSSFPIYISNYPSSTPFACAATDPGSITIGYNCVGFEGPAQRFSVDLLAEMLAA